MTKWPVLFLVLAFSGLCLAQTESATLSGRVSDSSGAAIVGAEVVLTNTQTNVEQRTKTNEVGLYVFAGVRPGTYRVAAGATGFRVLIKEGLTLHVQDELAENFSLTLGAISESITVTADATPINTTDASVSTVVDRNFAENLPMNGRSFQTLIQLAPGVVLTTANSYDGGQFSVNGQRADANYWTVDGVSANIGVSSNYQPGTGPGGALPGLSVQGGTNSLVSVDALQEFRIQTSTYAPEFGRTPGGQISILTRSGTNQFHGTLFDYFRNDILDANSWFNGYTNNPPLPKAEERQNDFGGVLGGPIFKDKTFFFFSYEGLRLRLPQTALSTVPGLAARQNAIPAMQPYLNAFPLPNGPDLGNGIAQFNASFSNRSTLDAYSIRIDHKLNDNLTFFGRYNSSPSQLEQRGLYGSYSLSTVTPATLTTQTATAGATWVVSSAVANDLRFNYSRNDSASSVHLDKFGGATPLSVSPFPSPYTSQDSAFFFYILTLSNAGGYSEGELQAAVQRQINIVDNFSIQSGSHSLKFGIDFRRLSPTIGTFSYSQAALFLDVPSSVTGNYYLSSVTSDSNIPLVFRNLGVFAQDTWRLKPRLTLTYGLRWDVDFSPSTSSGPRPLAVGGFDLNDLSKLALAPAGTPLFKTTYGNMGPRIGIAYQLVQKPNAETVLRGGFGVFYDLSSEELGNDISAASYPFGAAKFTYSGAFPLDSATAAPPPVTLASLSSSTGLFYAFDPNLKAPYTLQWNIALEQSLGKQQSISASYIGALGRRLIQSAYVYSLNNVTFGQAQAGLVSNAATSDYDALQLQFQRRLSRGLQAQASYTWSHSIDTASAGSALGSGANGLTPGVNPNQNRGPSDFDIRHALSAGLTYNLPGPRGNTLMKAMLGGWSVQNIIQARSAPPVNVYNSLFGYGSFHNAYLQLRPDVVPGQPFYLYGSQYPAGKALNAGAFTNPPTDANGIPLRQGIGRNALRGFGAAQWDFSVHRDFGLHERLKLQFRAEAFNLINHPNFGPPVTDLSNQTQFGLSTQMLGTSLNQSNGGGGLSPLYQIGGPRSIQLALKLIF